VPLINFNTNTTNIGILFAFYATTKIPNYIAEVSKRAIRLTDRVDYRNYTIINTSAIDYICNNYTKFIKFNSKPTYAYICIGASSVKVNTTSTIKIGILYANRNINNVTFSNILYALAIFVLIILHF
jgi:hypothetical protein